MTLTAIPEQPIAYIRERGPLSEIAERISRLSAAVIEAGLEQVGPPMARYFEDRNESDDLDYEVDIPVLTPEGAALPDRIGQARGGIIPAHHAIVTRHGGSSRNVHMGYTALTEELNALGYAIAGPPTEVYLAGPGSGDDPSSYVIELRLPIAR